MKVVEYWHGTIKNYKYDGDVSTATGDDSPLRQGAETGPRLVFGGYRGLWRQNSRSRLCSGGFSIYRYFWRREQVRGSPRRPRGRGRAQVVGRAPTLVGASGLFWPISDTPWASSGPKIIFVKFQVNWTPFGFPFLRYSKTRKKQKLALGCRLIG